MPRPTGGISNREIHRILRRRGATLVRITGGHSHWRTPDGTRLTVVAEGRHNDPTFRQLTQIAKAFGTTVEGLKEAA